MSLMDQQWCPTSVQVTVLQARGLRIKGKSGTNDAYAVMQVGKEKYQTSVAEKSVAPVWTEEAAFDLPPPNPSGGGGGGERGALHVHVMHRALVGPDKLLGQAVVNLLQLSEDKTRNKSEWFKLLDKTGKADKDRGEVLLDIQFMRNNMTASIFDLSAAGKSRSRLGKFKDKVRGKKKESDTVSSVVQSFTQVLTDSEEDANGDMETAAAKDQKKKKHKIKSLFSPKSNLQRNMSQSLSVLPANSSLSSSQSSGLNVDASEGKKKFKFMMHKRSGSSDSKDSSSGLQKHSTVEQSNLCINGSHVYSEEPQTRTSRIGSNFSLASSGHGSMEDVPERQYSPWTEEEEEMAEVDNIKENVDKEEEEERMRLEEERVRRQEEELEKFAKEKRRQEDEERKRNEEEKVKREKEEKKWRDEERKKQEEEERVRKECERLQKEAEEKRKLEEQERRIEEEKKQREKEEQIKMEEKRAQEERRRQEEEERVRRVEEEKRRLEEEQIKRIKEEKVRKEEEEKKKKEEEKAEEERRSREEEERVRREEECERLAEEKRKLEEQERRIEEGKKQRKLAEEKRRLEEEERKKAAEEKVRKEQEEKKRREEEKAEEERRSREEEERVRRQEEFEKKRRLAEEEKRLQEEEERIRKEEERAKKEKEEYERLVAEKQKLAEERKKIEAKEKIRREQEERVRVEEERKRKEEEAERVMREEEEKRRLEEQERRRIEEEEKKQREEQERIRKEEARRQEERARKEKEEYERLAEEQRRQEEQERLRKEKEEIKRLAEEKRRLEEQDNRTIEEEEEIRRFEEKKAERERKADEARKLESPAEVTSTNSFDDSCDSFEENHKSSAGLDSSTTKVSNVQQRCQSAVSSVEVEIISNDEKDLINVQREKRPAPQPPGRNQAERQRDTDVSMRHLAHVNKQSNDKDIKTASVLPQRSVQMIAPVSRSPTDTKSTQSLIQSSTTKGTSNAAQSKRPAPPRPRSVDEEPSSEHKKILTSVGNISAGGPEAKQVQIVYGLNPFEDDEDENVAQDYITTSNNTGSVCWPPAVSQTGSQTKIRSSKVAHAPPPPASITIPSASQVCDPESSVHAQKSPVHEAQCVMQNTVEETGVKKEVPPTTSRRLQPVKPLNPLEQQSVSVVQGEKDKSTEILGELQDKTKVNGAGLKGPYSQLTRDELISLVLKQEKQLSERDKKISELEEYIDNLLVRIIEEKPSILMSVSSIKKAV